MTLLTKISTTFSIWALLAVAVSAQVDWGVPSNPDTEKTNSALSNDVSEGQYVENGDVLRKCITEPCLGGFEQSSSEITFADILNLGVLPGPDKAESKLGVQSDVYTLPSERTKALPSIDIEILFDLGSARIRPDQIYKLASLLAVVKANESLANRGVVVLGHTDSRGSVSLNMRLSEARANAVGEFLRTGVDVPVFTKGVANTMLKFPLRPYADQNRRVQIVFVGF